MRFEDIELHTGSPTFAYVPVRRLEAKCEAATAFSSAPTVEEVNDRLRSMAASVGANAVIQVEYRSGVSMTSWRSMTGTGLAVKRESEDMPCPICAEPVKRAALKCRFCGAELNGPRTEPLPTTTVRTRPGASAPQPRPHLQEPLRSTNNPQWWILGAVLLFLLFLLSSVL